jgi:uncharacterized membrane protein
MWLLHFLPDSFLQFVVHAILIAGVIGCFLSFFVVNKILMAVPMLSRYVNVAQLVSAITLAAGVYFEGGYSAEMQWRARVAEVEAKVAQAEQEAKAANAVLDAKTNEKVKVIQGKQVIVKQFIDREVTKYNDQCNIPKPFVDAHNQSAEGPVK